MSYNIKQTWHYTKIVYVVSTEKHIFHIKFFQLFILVPFSSLFQTVKCHDNGVHPPTFPTGGTCVLSVIPFQDGQRRSAVVSAEARKWSTTPKCIDTRSKNWLDWKVHITPKTSAYDLYSLHLNIIVFVEWVSKLPRLKIKHN